MNLHQAQLIGNQWRGSMPKPSRAAQQGDLPSSNIKRRNSRPNIRHCPDTAYPANRNAALLAELTGITVIQRFPQPRHRSWGTVLMRQC